MRPNGGSPEEISYERQDDTYQAAFDSCLRDFAEGLAEGREFESTGRDNLRSLAATLACYEAAEANTVRTL